MDGDDVAEVLVNYGNCIAAHDDLEYQMRFDATRYAGFTDEVGLSPELGDNFRVAKEAMEQCAVELDLWLTIDRLAASNPLSDDDVSYIASSFAACINQATGASGSEHFDEASVETIDDIYAIESLDGVDTDLVFECRDSALFGDWQSFPQ